MPNWSGLHISRTTSSGHSSRSSSSRSTSSGRRFLAKSLRDFKLSFNVLCAIMGRASLCGGAAEFTNFVGQFRQELQDVVDNSDIGHLEDGSFRILVSGDQERTAFDASQMLERTTDAACEIDFWFDGFAG